MSTIDEIKNSVNHLTEQEREERLDRLDYLLEEPGRYESNWEKRWLDVAEERAKSLADGSVEPIPQSVVENFQGRS